MTKHLYISPIPQENRHSPRFTLSFPHAAVGAQQAVTWWLCWARSCCLVFPCPGFAGVGVRHAHSASRHALELQGQSAWQMDAGRSWKVESSSPERTTTHRLIHLQELLATTMGTLFWPAEVKVSASAVLVDKWAPFIVSIPTASRVWLGLPKYLYILIKLAHDFQGDLSQGLKTDKG